MRWSRLKEKRGFGGVVGDDLGDLVGMLVFGFFCFLFWQAMGSMTLLAQ